MNRPTRVQLLVTCLVDHLYPQVGDATVAILERLGLVVDVPPHQTCCGQPAFNGGFREDAATMARHTIDVFSATSDPVIVPSGSCADMIVNHYPELFADDGIYGPKATALAARTYELSQFLVDVMGVTDVGAAGHGTVAYHASCHGLRGLGLKTQPRRLLGAVQGITAIDLPDAETCCGFGGLFAIKMPELSGAMLEAKLDAAVRSGADTIVATDVSCLMHIGGGLSRAGHPIRVRHLAEVLADTAEPASASPTPGGSRERT